MNTTMLACLTPAAPAGAKAAKPTDASSDNAARGEFAQCMDDARDATTPQDAVPAQSAQALPAAAEPGSEAAPIAAPDLSALLPGWTAPAPHPVPTATTGRDESDDALAAVVATAASTAMVPAADATTPRPTPPLANLPVTTPQPAPARSDSATHTPPAPAEPARTSSEPRAPALDAPAANAMLPPGPQAPLPASPRQPEAAPPPSAHLAAPIDSSAFAPTLATQLRWWAQEGVQQAQLTLNPVEMGPVAVKIVVVDGREARIDFSADVAATRGAIEAALPVLAAALDESGLKLAGGGVHDGAAQRQAHWQAQSVTLRTREAGAARDGEPVAAPAPRANSGSNRLHLVA